MLCTVIMDAAAGTANTIHAAAEKIAAGNSPTANADDSIIPEFLFMIFMLAMSGYFSASETAFSTMNKTRMKTLAEKGSKTAGMAHRLASNYDKLISTILIGNNIVNIALASVATVLCVNFYGDEKGATMASVFTTIAVLIFGEISPKSIAKDYAEKFAMFAAPLLQLLIWILTPANYLFGLWKKLLYVILKPENNTKMSQEELLMFVEEVQQGGSIDQSDGELLRNAIEFSEREAKDILTPRVKLEAFPIDASKEHVARMFDRSKFSRLLVYEENIDRIVGVVHLKNFYDENGITKRNIKDILTPVVFVLPGEKISSLMRKLQQKQAQVAVVLDEFGGTCGIVTMEDVLEELVGEIWDEHDSVDHPFQQLSDHLWRVNASVHLTDFCDFFKIKVDSTMVSLNGWVMENFHKIPQKGDSFEYENLKITVTATEHRKVSLLEVRTAKQ